MQNTARRVSPRKKKAVTLSGLSEGCNGDEAGGQTVNIATTDDGDDDEFPDLETLLGGPTTMRKGRGARSGPKIVGRGTETGVVEENSEHYPKTRERRAIGTTRTKISARTESERTIEAKTISTAIIPPQIGPFLSTMTIPALRPTASNRVNPAQVPERESNFQTTTTTTARSSRQMQHASSPAKRDQAPRLSPVKKKGVALPVPRAKKGLMNNDQPDTLGSLMEGLSLQSGNPGSEEPDSDDVFRSKTSISSRKICFPKARIGSRAEEKSRILSSNFILNQADCRDDDGSDQDDTADEDELTDLSGFIVGDDEDVTFYEDAASDLPSSPEMIPRRRQLVRGSRGRKADGMKNSFGEKTGLDRPSKDVSQNTRRPKQKDDGEESLTKAMASVDLDGRSQGRGPRSESTNSASQSDQVEVIDLTQSPPASKPRKLVQLTGQRENSFKKGALTCSDSIDELSDKVNAILRFSPPIRKSSFKLSGRRPLSEISPEQPQEPTIQNPSTPPTTPPASPAKLRSPTKLKSPSKRNPLLLSPSKHDGGARILESPHRQSIDGFWSSEVINDWNDQYSPAKPPLTISPRKRWKIWENSGSNEDGSDSGSESPSESPARRAETGSPTKKGASKASPLKKTTASADRKSALAAKKKFDAEKVALAQSLLKELDDKVSDGELGRLSLSTGGVKVEWSKNLRSTAGRAHWRRTVVKRTKRSPTKAGADTADPPGARDETIRVQHFASIELAEKVIDSEERLFSTLAHEYCHLANFMVSGVRNQPHGASFKRWAQRVTSTFSSHPSALYRSIQVTTKHSYDINHKYLWVCAGTPPSATRGMLNLPDDEGCGAEYGRHSKSVDPDKHRCGKCKGVLVQVRPTPRRVDPARKGKSPFKKNAATDGGGVLKGLEEQLEAITIEDD